MIFRKKGFLIVGAGTCGIFLLAELIFIVIAGAGLATEKKLLRKQYRELSRLYHRAPFPSSENVAVEKEKLDELEYRIGELAAEIGADPFPQHAVDPADFSACAQNVIERFQKRAEKAGVKLPDSGEVGFAKYASEGAVPDRTHLPRLSRQLYSVECVAAVLVNSGVESIEYVTRDFFDEASDLKKARRRIPQRNQDRFNDGAAGVEVGGSRHSGKLFSVEQVGVSFVATEDTVLRVLDHFAAAPHFMVISEFSHETLSEILEYTPATAKQCGVDVETQEYLSGGLLVGKKALSRPERIVAGNERVRMKLVVDVYNFDPEIEL